MKNFSLIEHLRLLNKKEIKQFKDFLRVNHYSKKVPSDLKFIEAIESLYPKFYLQLPFSEKPLELDEQKLFRLLYPEKKQFNYSTIRTHNTRLKEQVQLFLAFREIQDDEQLKDELVLRAYEKRNASQLFYDLSKNFINRLSSIQNKSAEDHYKLFQVNYNLFTDLSSNRWTIKIEDIINHLVSFFSIMILTLKCDLLNRNHLKDNNQSIPFFEEVFQYVNRNLLKENLFIDFHLKTIEWHTSGHEVSIENTNNTFFQHSSDQSDVVKRRILELMINGLIKQSNNGNKKVNKNICDLFQLGLDHGLLTQNNRINSNTFLNQIIFRVSINQLSWANQFYLEYHEKLGSGEGELVRNLARAFLLFHEARLSNNDPNLYHKCVELLPLTKQNIPFHFKIFAYSIGIRAYFNLDIESDSNAMKSASLAKSFKNFLQLQKGFNKEKSQPYLNFLDYFEKIRMQDPNIFGSKKSKANLIQEIKDHPKLILKEWLEEKIQEF